MTQIAMFRAADRYVHRIRNQRKRAYAAAYWRFLRGVDPEPERGELSVMAAQAVRMELREIMRAHHVQQV